ncbi:hypothetical protein BDV19DRAFT_400293 [Aspergillus venezuelensis]
MGRSILLAILQQTQHTITQIVRRESKSKANNRDIGAAQKKMLTTIALGPLSASINGSHCALNGAALEAQEKIQDAADEADVRRFYPSEYVTANRNALHHPAIKPGRMTYTLIGCGDFYNQDRESTWCPWTQVDIDFTHIDDLVSFVVKTVQNPVVAEYRSLNVVTDRISYDETADLLEGYSGKKIEKGVYLVDAMERAWNNPRDVPDEVKGKSAFPDDFPMLV